MTFPLNSKKLSTKTEETTSYIHMASSRMKSSLMKIWSRQHKYWSITEVQRSMTIKTISILVRNRILLYFNATVSFGRIYQFIFQKRIRRIYWRRIYRCKEIGIGIKKLWRRIPKSGKNSKFQVLCTNFLIFVL